MKSKIIITLIIIFVFTPLLSFFVYPKHYAGSASGNYWESIVSWGIYPFVFLHYGEGYGFPCDRRGGESCEMIPIPPKSFSSAFYDIRDGFGLEYALDSKFFNYYINIIINLIASYLIASLLVFIYSKIKRNR